MDEIIEKQILSKPKLKGLKRVPYWEPRPGNQIHGDTAFWKESGKSGSLVPILVFVDVATKFVGLYVQEKKNEKVLEHFLDFRRSLAKRFEDTNTESSVLITDGAHELALKHPGLTHKVSKGINKAVFAENAIKRMRQQLRKLELSLNLQNLNIGEVQLRITKDNLQDILDLVTTKLNKTAKQAPEPKFTEDEEPLLETTPVFLINMHKYFPYQTKSVLRKNSYEYPWYLEPFRITEKRTIHGITQYRLKDYYLGKEVKWWVYRDQIQVIDPRVASDYIKFWYEMIDSGEVEEYLES